MELLGLIVYSIILWFLGVLAGRELIKSHKNKERQYLSAKAMQGILANINQHYSTDYISSMSIANADALINKLEKTI